MSKYSDEFLQKIADILNEKISDDEDGDVIYDLEEGLTIDVDGQSLDLKFVQQGGEGDGAWIGLMCTSLQDNPTDSTVGLDGYHSSWDSTEWSEVKVIKPKPVIEYTW